MSKIIDVILYPQRRAVALYRLSRWCSSKRMKWLGRLLWNANITLNGIEISPYADIGSGLVIQHTVGTVIGKGVKAGKHLTLYQNVTIGARGDLSDKTNYPVIGDHVALYPGCVVVGPIRIGNHAQVAANAVVIRDVPDGAIVAGIPAKIINGATKAATPAEMKERSVILS